MVDAKEPFTLLLTQGMVLGRTFKDTATGRYLIGKDAPTGTEAPAGVQVAWEKMSKSKGNGVDPMHVVDSYGADITRLNILFKVSSGPPPVLPLSPLRNMERWYFVLTWCWCGCPPCD